MLQTNHSLRRRSLLTRKLLPELDPRFARYPLEHGFPPLPFNLRTMNRFWPIVPFYGRKAVKRLRRLGKHLSTSTGPTSTQARMQLWRDPEIREILRVDRMLSAEIMDEQALGNFLEQSQQQEFLYEGQWARVLTLEAALRSINQPRKAWPRTIEVCPIGEN